MAEGRFQDAHRLIARMHDLYSQLGLSGPDDERVKFEAVDLMQSGDVEEGKKIFQRGPVDIDDGQEVLGLVYTGDVAAAQSDLGAMEVKYPRATMIHLFWVPRTKAAIAMVEHKPAEAAALLETARLFDKTNIVIPWQRGNAYLAAGQPAAAERDFRQVVTHPEIDPTSCAISLSWLGLGRALAAKGNRPAAVEAYQHFLALWAHADPDAKFLVEARNELKALQAFPPARGNARMSMKDCCVCSTHLEQRTDLVSFERTESHHLAASQAALDRLLRVSGKRTVDNTVAP
jgi:tetratricopeptide (TPR) repeat protein